MKKLIPFILCFSSLHATPTVFPEVIDFYKIPLFQDVLLREEENSWRWKLAQSAYDLGYISFSDSPEVGAFITLLQQRYLLEDVVETGTFFGASSAFFSLFFNKVYTIEGSEKVYKDAKGRLSACPNVQCFWGSSEKILPSLLPSLKDKRLLFYLDAHSYCLDAERDGYHYWPLLEELEEISKTHKDNCIIIVDDCFVPNTDIHGCLDSSGTIELSHELMKAQLRKVFTGYTFHYLIPRTLRGAKFVAIPKKWQKEDGYIGRVDVLPGMDFWDDMRTDLPKVKKAGFDIRVSNQFFNGEDRSNYVQEIANDTDLKKIVVVNNTVDPKYLSQFPKDKLVLFAFEPLILPYTYYDPCSRVYTWNDDLVDGVKFFKLYYPYMMPMTSDLLAFEAKKLCVMVSGSDNSYPERKNELYSERMKIVEFFETKPMGEFEIYGRYWVKRHYRDFRGSIAGHFSGNEKLSVLKKYRFSICFENTKGLRGYISEKIFDCFAAGCVPIYWGASNIEDYIPKGCFIDYRDFKDKEELYQFIKTMPKAVYEEYLDAISCFLKSDKAKLFSPDHFEELFYEAVSR